MRDHVLLPSTSPADFYTGHLEPRQARYSESSDGDVAPKVWRTVAELLTSDAALPRQNFHTLVHRGEPSKCAAILVAGWVAGPIAETVGFTFATASAGVLVDETVRLRLHPDGWPDRVDVSSCRIVVTPEHPWGADPTVEVVANPVQVVRLTVDALVSTLQPYLMVCRTFAKVGLNPLWAEVADGLGGATASSPDLDGTGATITALQALLEAPGAPWRRRPKLWCATGATGQMVLSQKGGCCLAYTVTSADNADQPVDDQSDADYADFYQQFPTRPNEPRYCASCRFRDQSDVQARLLFWADRRNATDSAPPAP